MNYIINTVVQGVTIDRVQALFGREMLSVSFYLSVVVLSVVFFLFVLFLFVSMCVEYAADNKLRRQSDLQRRQQLLSSSC